MINSRLIGCSGSPECDTINRLWQAQTQNPLPKAMDNLQRRLKRNLDRLPEVLLASRKLKQIRPTEHHGQKTCSKKGSC